MYRVLRDTHPIASAGIAFVATTRLTNAICAAGAFGVLGSAGMPPDVLCGAIRDIQQGGYTAFGVEYHSALATAEHVAVCAAEKVPVVVLSDLKSADVRVAYQVGSVAEAKTKAASADLLIVQGSESGGHNRAEAPLFSIVLAVVDALGGKLPIFPQRQFCGAGGSGTLYRAFSAGLTTKSAARIARSKGHSVQR